MKLADEKNSSYVCSPTLRGEHVSPKDREKFFFSFPKIDQATKQIIQRRKFGR